MPALVNGTSQCRGWLASLMWEQELLAQMIISLFDANYKADHPAVKFFTRQLSSKIEEIEKKSYTVLGMQVTFSFELVPLDMKFLSFLDGELNNAASYFSSFANASKADCISLNDKFGTTPDCKWTMAIPTKTEHYLTCFKVQR